MNEVIIINWDNAKQPTYNAHSTGKKKQIVLNTQNSHLVMFPMQILRESLNSMRWFIAHDVVVRKIYPSRSSYEKRTYSPHHKLFIIFVISYISLKRSLIIRTI